MARYAPFFKEENQLYVVKEMTDYTAKNKATTKSSRIVEILEERAYDLAIYFEDDYNMLKEAYRLLGDKILCLHISNFLE